MKDPVMVSSAKRMVGTFGERIAQDGAESWWICDGDIWHDTGPDDIQRVGRYPKDMPARAKQARNKR